MAPETNADAQGVDMREYTRRVMERLEGRLGTSISWVGVNHAGAEGHTEHGHTHVIAQLPRRLERDDFQQLRLSARVEFTVMLQEDLSLSHDYGGGERDFHSYTQEVGGDLRNVVKADLYLDEGKNGGKGLITQRTLEQFYDHLQKGRPELFNGEQFNKERFEKELRQSVATKAYDELGNSEVRFGRFARSYKVSEEERHRYVSQNGGGWSEVVASKIYLSRSEEGEGKSREAVIKELSDELRRGGKGFGADITEGGGKQKPIAMHNSLNL